MKKHPKSASGPVPAPVTKEVSPESDDGYVFELSGGNLALDFANTASRRPDPEKMRERLLRFGRFVSWGEQAGLLKEKEAHRMRAGAKEHPRKAEATLRRATALREAIYALFSAFARAAPVRVDALETINTEIPEAFGCLRLGPESGRIAWRWSCEDESAAPILAPVVRAAAELLTSEDLSRVRECGSETCSWLFLDRSKNGSRRWCDMSVCGNRAKARRHYAREKKVARGKPRPSS